VAIAHAQQPLTHEWVRCASGDAAPTRQ